MCIIQQLKKKLDNHVHGLEKEPLNGVWATDSGLLIVRWRTGLQGWFTELWQTRRNRKGSPSENIWLGDFEMEQDPERPS